MASVAQTGVTELDRAGGWKVGQELVTLTVATAGEELTHPPGTAGAATKSVGPSFHALPETEGTSWKLLFL